MSSGCNETELSDSGIDEMEMVMSSSHHHFSNAMNYVNVKFSSSTARDANSLGMELI